MGFTSEEFIKESDSEDESSSDEIEVMEIQEVSDNDSDSVGVADIVELNSDDEGRIRFKLNFELLAIFYYLYIIQIISFLAVSNSSILNII